MICSAVPVRPTITAHGRPKPIKYLYLVCHNRHKSTALACRIGFWSSQLPGSAQEVILHDRLSFASFSISLLAILRFSLASTVVEPRTLTPSARCIFGPCDGDQTSACYPTSTPYQSPLLFLLISQHCRVHSKIYH